MELDWYEAAGLALVCVAGAFALWQYWISQRWQRLRYELEMEERLSTDPVLRLYTMFLDWEDRELPLPASYQRYADERGYFKHTLAKLDKALESDSYDRSSGVLELRPELRTPDHLIYVEVFDEFSAYLDRVSVLHRNRFVKSHNMPILQYFVQKLRSRKCFQEYMRNHDMIETIEFVERLSGGRQPSWVTRWLW